MSTTGDQEAPLTGLQLETNCYLVQGTKFEVDKRYKIIEPISQGAYGIVCVAEEMDACERVAVKKIECIFEHITISKRTLRRAPDLAALAPREHHDAQEHIHHWQEERVRRDLCCV
ncbi:unnamed protein product [Prorocentrum cordatum]|uniref:Mitogen-activated protein kinase n=1 Tax=Prorocentrum cordatum TaxID=2364126 RepID=A0ABN9UQ91_9DINO|nr:unnamed protein product [Polarella glacialis]